jgi:GNAT superfamily N-acetyltransferase
VSVVLRAPHAGDTERLGLVHVRAWQAAYRGAMPDTFLDSLSPAEWAARWVQRLAAAGPAVNVVAEHEDLVVGFVSFGPERGASVDGEVYAINVHPDAWGTGAGPALLARASDDLRDVGFSAAVLWVVAANARARRFYEREGWSADGAGRDLEIGGAPVSEVRYRRSL